MEAAKYALVELLRRAIGASADAPVSGGCSIAPVRHRALLNQIVNFLMPQ
ncbi:MAG: hypothetical protein ACXWCY_25065 [Burkholderiales bacterium]